MGRHEVLQNLKMSKSNSDYSTPNSTSADSDPLSRSTNSSGGTPIQPEIGPDEGPTLPALLEALLFASPGPVAASQLAAVLEKDAAEIEAGLKELEVGFSGRGLRLQRHLGKYQLTTAPEAGPAVERFLGLEASTRLSRAALETLAIVAYRQPVTRPEIDAVRGVNSDGVLKSLLSKGLVQEMGRADRPGRPILYSTTADFLRYFGLSSLEELPALFDSSQPTGLETLSQ
jgi:segregation and condensation protein B